MSVVDEIDRIKAFETWIQDRVIVIADPSAAARTGLFKIFQDFGVKTEQITLVNSLKQAAEQIAAVKPHIVVSEYDLDRGCGLDLLQSQKAQNPKDQQTIFLLATANTSQSAVARASEEDIDGYILKPFTPDAVKKTLVKVALNKIRPPQYLLTIERGKQELEKGAFDAAEELFKQACALDPAPALAMYYVGQAEYLKKIFSKAAGCYSKGLEFNKIHYKCMVGLYEALMSQKDHVQAYEVVKKIAQYFPANPKRLGEVLRLAITNARYEDVEKYHSVFCSIDERDEVLIKYICAALVVCGKYYLSHGAKDRALELFKKAGAAGTGRTKILKEIVQALVDDELPREARAYLSKFPAENQSSDEYLFLNFQVLDLEGDAQKTIHEGRALLTRGLTHTKLFEILIKRSIECGMQSEAEKLVAEAALKYPDQKPFFESFLKKPAA